MSAPSRGLGAVAEERSFQLVPSQPHVSLTVPVSAVPPNMTTCPDWGSKSMDAKSRGYVETVFGRRLWLPEINGGNGPHEIAQT